MGKFVDLRGQQFGRLTVLTRSSKVPVTTPTRRPGAYWECRCSCGKTAVVSGSALVAGNNRSCGCWRNELNAARLRARMTCREPWLADLNYYVNALRHSKKRHRGPRDSDLPIPWELSLQEYVTLVTGECYYCGAQPSQQPKGAYMRTLGLKRNGIDRVDNEIGYRADNCVSCCAVCNRDKSSHSQAEFIDITRRRYQHLKVTGLLATVQDHLLDEP